MKPNLVILPLPIETKQTVLSISSRKVVYYPAGTYDQRITFVSGVMASLEGLNQIVKSITYDKSGFGAIINCETTERYGSDVTYNALALLTFARLDEANAPLLVLDHSVTHDMNAAARNSLFIVAISDIDSLEQEKIAIQKILPKVFYELSQLREGLDSKRKELSTYDNAIGDIEKNYGDFLYSPNFFRDL
eukprot:gene21992-28081_t